MASLAREVRKKLENVVKEARRVAERGARKALKEFAVEDPKAPPGLNTDQGRLRNRLRAHGRQLGDRRDEKRRTQAVDRLASECAYEHWHRLLFARFLAEANLLIEPDTRVPISLDECRELALERDTDWLPLASGFAEKMLPQIFRVGDPVLEVVLPPETRQKLEELLKSLPSEVFAADDSLGWVYQFWQADRKDEVNESGVKIGADELAAVTQLFTEDYMVLFLLHNTLGAWWTAKRKAEGKRAALPGYEWMYLRLNDDGSPAAGTFDGWPQTAKDLRLLDPCMGSGHFLVFALPILVAFRMEEEGLSREEAVEAVLRDNLFGLELDPRCTQIAAFNLALMAWRMTGYRALPLLNLACSGLGINSKEDDWLSLAGEDADVRGWMHRLYGLFQQAPILGSLIDPKRVLGELFVAHFAGVRTLLEHALAAEQPDESASELAVAAKGLLQAARFLGDTFTLVATNVPYLGAGKQDESLTEHCESYHGDASGDLATVFIDRCLGLCNLGGTAAIVTKQDWLFIEEHKQLRRRLLSQASWNLVARLGPRAFETISGERVNVALLAITRELPSTEHAFLGLDAVNRKTVSEKAAALKGDVGSRVSQRGQIDNPDSRVVFEQALIRSVLGTQATSSQGVKTGDDERFRRYVWEIDGPMQRWRSFQTTVKTTRPYGGLEELIDWSDNGALLARRQGLGAWERRGVLVSQMGEFPATLYIGDVFDSNGSAIVPRSPEDLAAIWVFCSSGEYRDVLRAIDQSLKPTNSSLIKVPFDLARWQQVAAETYPDGLPRPQSDDPTQCLFNGHPRDSEHPLHVAIARLVGYRWPRQMGSKFPDCPALSTDGLERHADQDGIACIPSLKGEAPAADRLRALLADAFGADWSALKQAALLAEAGHPGQSLDEWLREVFFEEHCELFRQRPFVWHVWDGLKNGFSALVNYHRLTAPDGEGRRTLEKLMYSYLGEWIDRQRADQKADVEGADARVAAAVHLKRELERILDGELPYDLFARWKPLHEQPIGWDPDLGDGVRVNVRPFVAARPLSAKGKNSCILRVRPKIKWEKDRGREPERPRKDFPWFWSWDEKTDDFPGGGEFDGNRWNDLHYTRAFKQAARERNASRQEARAR